MDIKHKSKSQTDEYATWARMLDRCYEESNPRWKDYGGRGIKVCDEWRFSFENFLADMGKKPLGKTSLDRIDNDKSYSAENCRWATNKEQCNNKKTNIKVEIDGITKSISEWCEILNLKVSSIFDRINKQGKSPKEALLLPIKHSPLIKRNGEIKTLYNWCKELKIYPQSVCRYIRIKNKPPEKALEYLLIRKRPNKIKKGKIHGNNQM